MDQPQPCTKCKKLPEDILMLACSHDLCLDCASERLAFEMKKKKPANVPAFTSRASSAKSAMRERPSMRKALLNWKNLFPRRQQPNLTLNREHPMIELKGWSLAATLRKKRPKKRVMTDNQWDNTHMLRLPTLLLPQIISYWAVFLQRNLALSTMKSRSFISASIASASVFVLNASYTVFRDLFRKA